MPHVFVCPKWSEIAYNIATISIMFNNQQILCATSHNQNGFRKLKLNPQ